MADRSDGPLELPSATLLPLENYAHVYKLDDSDIAKYELPPPLPSPRLLPLHADVGTIHDKLNSDSGALRAKHESSDQDDLRAAIARSVSKGVMLFGPLSVPSPLQQAPSAEQLPFATDKDVINYFARFGADTDVKFAHLVPVAGPEYRPYDLKVVDIDEQCQEYYTISPAGVIFTCPGQPSECTTLANWVRDSAMFNLLRSIRFFKHYLHRKVFQIWKENVRQRLFINQRKKVADHLFHNRQTCTEPILELHRHMLEVAAVNLVQFDIRTPCDMPRFLEVQQDQWLRGIATLDEIFRKFAERTQAVVNQINELNTDEEEEVVSLFELQSAGGAAARNKSLVRLKQERIEKRHANLRAMLERKSLPEFIRFCDYIAVETVVATAVTSLQILHEELVKNRKSGLFEITVQFSDRGDIVYSPSREETLAALESVLEGMVSAVSNVNRVIYLNNTSMAGPNIADIIRTNNEFVRLASQVRAKVLQDYAVAAEYAFTFENIRPVFEFNRRWSYQEYRKTRHGAAELRNTINIVSGWYRELDKMRNKCIGALEIDSKRLKAELIPLRAARLQELKEYLVKTARERCQKTIAEFKEVTQKLQHRPGKLHEFAAQMQVLEDIQNRGRELIVQGVQVHEIYQIMHEHDVSTPSHDLVALEDLSDKQDRYREELDKALTFREGKLPEMAHALHMNVFKLNESVSSLSTSLNHEQYSSRKLTRDPALVLSRLDALQAKIKEAANTASIYSNYQKLFGLTLYSFADVANLQDKFSSVQRVWALVHEWQTQHRQWCESNFDALNVEAIQEHVNAVYKEAFKLHDLLSTGVTEWLRNSVGEFRGVIPCLLRLSTGVLKPHHWEKVFRAIKLPYVPDAVFSLSTLLDNHIIDHADEVISIVAAALRERELDQTLTALASRWADMQFGVRQKEWERRVMATTPVLSPPASTFFVGPPSPRAAPDAVLLEGGNKMLSMVDDDLVTLHVMLQDPNLGSLVPATKQLAEQLQLVGEVVSTWMTCQLLWCELSEIFCAGDIQRQLPTEFQQFKAVDSAYRTQTNAVAAEPSVLPWMSLPQRECTLLATLSKGVATLEQVKFSASQFLMTKRAMFARLYFVSDAALFRLYAGCDSADALRSHVRTVMPALQHIDITVDDRNTTAILAVGDGMGDVLHLSRACLVGRCPELWLEQLNEAICAAIGEAIDIIWTSKQFDTQSSVMLASPRQAALVANQMLWTAELERALCQHTDSGSVLHALRQFSSRLLQTIGNLAGQISGEASRRDRLVLSEVAVAALRIRDVTEELSAVEGGATTDSFLWHAQLRYSWRPDVRRAAVHIASFATLYGNEYLGRASALVMESVTERCYLSMVQTLRSCTGFVLAGPPQSGKESAVRTLAASLGTFFWAQWCTREASTAHLLGRLCAGIAQQGGWLCLKHVENLSQTASAVLRHCLAELSNGFRQAKTHLDLNGHSVRLQPNVGVVMTTAVCTTGSSSSVSYPVWVSQEPSFRSCTVLRPNVLKVAEGLCLWHGLNDARSLACVLQGFVEMLAAANVASCRLADIKRLIHRAAALKAANPELRARVADSAWLREAVEELFAPMIGRDLMSMFESIVVISFPANAISAALALPKLPYDQFSRFLLDERWASKLAQLQRQLEARQATAVVGPTGCGKSTAIQLLVGQDSVQRYQRQMRIFPAAGSVENIFGRWNADKQQWEEGLCAAILCGNQSEPQRLDWLVLDGPIDCTLSDQLLPLLDYTANTRLVFETSTLQNVSPDFISRCGISFFEDNLVTWQSALHAWESTTSLRNHLTQPLWQHLLQQVHAVLPECVQQQEQIVLHERRAVLSSTRDVASRLLQFLTLWVEHLQVPSNAQAVTVLDTILAWSLHCTVGSTLSEQSRAKFCEWIVGVFQHCNLPQHLAKYVFDSRMLQLTELHASDMPVQLKPVTSCASPELYVPSPEHIVLEKVLECHRRARKPVLLLGEEQTGKTALLYRIRDQAMCIGNAATLIQCSDRTQRADIAAAFTARLARIGRHALAAESGKTLEVFIDDMHFLEAGSGCSANSAELLRQLLETDTLYSFVQPATHDVAAVRVNSWTLTTTMRRCEHGHNQNQDTWYRRHFARTLRHFAVFGVPAIAADHVHRVLSVISFKGLTSFGAEHQIQTAMAAVVVSTAKLYDLLQAKQLDRRFGCQFGLHDVARAVHSIKRLLEHEVMICLEQLDLGGIWRHQLSTWLRGRLLSEKDRFTFDEALLDSSRALTDGNQNGPDSTKPLATKENFVHPVVGRLMGKWADKGLSKGPILLAAMHEYTSASGTLLAIPPSSISFRHFAFLVEALTDPGARIALRGHVRARAASDMVRLAAQVGGHDIMEMSTATLADEQLLLGKLEAAVRNDTSMVCLVVDPADLDEHSVALLEEMRQGRAYLAQLSERPAIAQWLREHRQFATPAEQRKLLTRTLAQRIRTVVCIPCGCGNQSAFGQLRWLCRRDLVDWYSQVLDGELNDIAITVLSTRKRTVEPTLPLEWQEATLNLVASLHQLATTQAPSDALTITNFVSFVSRVAIAVPDVLASDSAEAAARQAVSSNLHKIQQAFGGSHLGKEELESLQRLAHKRANMSANVHGKMLLILETVLAEACFAFMSLIPGSERKSVLHSWVQTGLVQIGSSDSMDSIQTVAARALNRVQRAVQAHTEQAALNALDKFEWYASGDKLTVLIDPCCRAVDWLTRVLDGAPVQTLVASQLHATDTWTELVRLLGSSSTVLLLVSEMPSPNRGRDWWMQLWRTFVSTGRRRKLAVAVARLDNSGLCQLPAEVLSNLSFVNLSCSRHELAEAVLKDIVGTLQPSVAKEWEELQSSCTASCADLQQSEDAVLQFVRDTESDSLQSAADGLPTLRRLLMAARESEKLAIDIHAKRTAAAAKLEALRPLAIRAATVFECLRTISPRHATFDCFRLMVASWLKQQKPFPKETRVRKAIQIDIPGLVGSLTLHLCRLASTAFESSRLPGFRFLLATLLAAEMEPLDRAGWRHLFKLLAHHERRPCNCLASAGSMVVDDTTIQEVAALEAAVDCCCGLSKDVKLRIEIWTRHLQSAQVDFLSLPMPWNKKLNPFQRLLVCLVICPARFSEYIDKFVAFVLGPELTSAEPFTIADIVGVGCVGTPIVVCSPDPSHTVALLRLLAEERGARWANDTVPNNNSVVSNEGDADEGDVDKGEVWALLQHGSPLVLGVQRSWRIYSAGEDDRDRQYSFAALHVHHELQCDLPSTMAALLATVCGDGGGGSSSSKTVRTPLVIAAAFVHTVLLAKQHTIAGCSSSRVVWSSIDFIRLVEDLLTFSSSSAETLQALTLSNYEAKLVQSCQRRQLRTIIKQAVGACNLRDNTLTLQRTMYPIPTSGALPDVVRFCKSLPASFEILDATQAGGDKQSEAISLVRIARALAFDDRLSDVQLDKTIANLLHQLPPEFTKDELENRISTDRHDPLWSFAVQEARSWTCILSRIRDDLQRLSTAADTLDDDGIDDDDHIAGVRWALRSGRVPEPWCADAALDDKLLSLTMWSQRLTGRLKQLKDWVRAGTPPASINLGDLLHPHGLIGALKQYAWLRSPSIPGDAADANTPACDIHSRLIRPGEQVPAMSDPGVVQIHGLYLVGAAEFDATRQELVHIRSSPTTISFDHHISRLPPVLMWASTDTTSTSNTFRCPLFIRPPTREADASNFVLDLELPSSENEEYWLLRGCIALCRLD